ncbi:uncharacterized protein LOC120739141 [Simochromis diagramma]|uniref:uncharacterized protein LOC120739141 n=1 Tax=Simochromis diagramma TaxID=43689 RepID=UPI001A7E5863|nr:uncharacterized protein LOC120739141 [Simochromis diagramma]
MCSAAAHRNMQWTHIILALLNIMWIAFFLPPHLVPVFVQRRSTSISDEEILLREFCIQPPPDINWISSVPAVYIPDNKTNSTNTSLKRDLDGTKATTSPVVELKVPGVTTPSETVSHSSAAAPQRRVKQQPNSPFQANYASGIRCCRSFSHIRIKQVDISSYYITDRRCPMTAVIFVTKKSREICVDPSSPSVRNYFIIPEALLRRKHNHP